jgi:CRISPR-associated protein Csb1
MPIDLASLYNQSRLLIEATLRVAPGFNGRFQPTGFPDLGAALHTGVRLNQNGHLVTLEMLLVESAQSIANWLEAVCLDGDDYNDDCRGIPYVRVLDGHNNNRFLTSSVLEPHRLASDYVLDAKNAGSPYKDELARALEANKARPVHIPSLVPEIFRRDPGCVLHGVFLERIDGRLRLPRLVSASIDAAEPEQANSGGVYRGQVTAKDNIPYPRQEFTSTDIKASFIIHLGTLRSYRLGATPNPPALGSEQQGQWTNEEAFLVLWALYKINRFLNGYLRLRTACEFEVGSITTTPALANDWQSNVTGALTMLKAACFPSMQDPDEWKQRRVCVRTYAIDIVGESDSIPDSVTDDMFDLSGFDHRAELKQVERGRGARKQSVRILQLKGDWQDDEDRKKLLDQNPRIKEGEEEENPAHKFVQQALKKWDAKLKKQRGESATEEEAGES